jgi:SAM-dependent methyltransferase
MTDRDTDLGVLRTEAYADPGRLDDRRALYEYQDPRPDFFGWILDQVDWPPAGRVLDVGCGPGSHLERLTGRAPDLTMVAADVSTGMLAAARAAVPGCCPVALDAAALALVDDSFDRVMANHMLYHVADLDRTVGELRRVLIPGGRLLAITNSVEHLAELYGTLAAAAGLDRWPRPTDRFTLEDHGPDLARHFDHVELRHHVGQLVVPAVAPVVTYARSMQALTGRNVAPGEWEPLMDAVGAAVAARIETDGAFRITTHVGAFVCW